MQANAVLTGFLLLATLGIANAQVNGSSVNITGGATPTVNSGSTTNSNTASTATNDPTIIVRPKTKASARGGTGQAVGNQVQVVNEGYQGNPQSYTGTTTSNINQTLRNVPELVAPSVNGGANGCAVGVSGGVAVAGFGITTGAGWSDPDCERRQLAALTFNMNEHDLAQEILCDSKEVRAARLRMGKPCLVDQAPQVVATTEAQRIDPALLRRQQDNLASQQPIITKKPDWCETSSPEELRKHKECN